MWEWKKNSENAKNRYSYFAKEHFHVLSNAIEIFPDFVVNFLYDIWFFFLQETKGDKEWF